MNGTKNQTGPWRKSDACMGSSNCVEIAVRAGGMAVRDSKDPGGPVLEFTAAEWAAFLDGVRDGQFDRRA